MECKVLVQRGNTLNVKCVIDNSNTTTKQQTNSDTPKFIINGAAIFQVGMISSMNVEYEISDTRTYNNQIFVRFYKKTPNENDLMYTIKLSCDKYSINNQCFTSDDRTWHLIHNETTSFARYAINLNVIMDIIPKTPTFAPLYEDEQLIDYELRGHDGSVHVHRTVLAAASPVLHRMLCGPWKETMQGVLEVPSTSKTTLQDFKRFLYTRTLPNTGLEELLVLAAYYLIPDLEHKCVNMLVNSLTAQNVCDLLEIAVKNKSARLMLAILHSVQNNEIQIEDIRKSVLHNLQNNEDIRRESKEFAERPGGCAGAGGEEGTGKGAVRKY